MPPGCPLCFGLLLHALGCMPFFCWASISMATPPMAVHHSPQKGVGTLESQGTNGCSTAPACLAAACPSTHRRREGTSRLKGVRNRSHPITTKSRRSNKARLHYHITSSYSTSLHTEIPLITIYVKKDLKKYACPSSDHPWNSMITLQKVAILQRLQY